MTTTSEAAPTFRRAVILMTASSFLVPAAGVLTSPILARALGAGGRGELAAAIAPASLALAVATLGLPDALTYFLAKHPRITRAALSWATLISVALGATCLLVALGALPFLSAGNTGLGRLILLAMALAIPALVVGVFRGAAVGRQMWVAVAVERLINTSLRILAFALLWMLGQLTVLTAVLVSCLTPVVAGVVYFRLLLPSEDEQSESLPEAGTLRLLVGFGAKIWFGSVASMLVARIGQILMTPLSSVEDLGLYTVASTISDVPLVVAMAIQGTLYGVNSRQNDAEQLTTTTRVTLLLGLVGCTLIGVTLPFWIQPLFGADFAAATIPTLVLMFSALLCIPGLMAATAVNAWGRPGLRSLGLVVTLVANVMTFVLLVPRFGVMGACWTSIASNVVMTAFMVVAASRVLHVRKRDFLVIQSSDVSLARRETARICVQVLSRVQRRNR